MTNELKQRIVQINNGEVPQGYKKTKVGIVPSEWKVDKISSIIKLCERPINMADDTEYELVTVRRGYNGIDSRGLFFGEKILVKNQFEVKENDFIISKRQISHGACGVLPKELDGAIVSNEYNVFTPNGNTDIFFFNLLMKKPKCKNLFYLMSDGVHIEKLLFKTKDWMKQKIALPTFPEQQKIAEILTTCDKVIKLKEKLIAEKQKQKKYLMQQLLTGKKRLKGFSVEWKKEKLKGTATYKSNSLTASSLENYEGEQLYPVYDANKIICCINSYQLKSEYISIIKDGAGVGRLFYCESKSSIIGTMGGIVAKENIVLRFLFYRMKLIDFNKYINGSTIPHVYFKDYGLEKINLPPLPEQTAIANILSTADKEIQLLEQNLAEWTNKKKSLMQLLLTGIVRVTI